MRPWALALLLLAPLGAAARPPATRYAPEALGQPIRRFGLAARPGKSYTGEPISLVLKDADLADTLQHLGKLIAKNVVIDPSVRGTVTVSLRDVPADQVLDLLLAGHGLAAVVEGNVLVVGGARRLSGW